MAETLFVLGATDPEMLAIEGLLAAHAAPHVRAMLDGKRVYPANAYRAALPPAAGTVLARGGTVFLVECVAHAAPGVVRIDHHFPGHPGYGRPPADYWSASSLGQTVAALGRYGIAEVAVTPQLRLLAAADHCLGAAYRGQCPGVDPAALLDWHVVSRAAFERRAVEAVLADVAAACRAIADAPRVHLVPGIEAAADMRQTPTRELLIAAAREGQCCLTALKARDGRTKIGCLVGTPVQVDAFMHLWAPAQHLVDIYGDPVRGFAGAYVTST